MKLFTKFKKGLCFVLVIALCLTSSFVLVSAETFEDNKGVSHEIIGQNANEDASYTVSETVETKILEFGLLYKFDKGFVNTLDPSEITADMNAAGGGAYASSGKMKDNTYYPADVRVFEISPDLGLQIVPWVKFRNGNWSLNTVLAMAKDYEASHPGFKVVAAINGDYFDINSLQNYNYCSTGATVSEGNNFKIVDNWNQIGFKDGTLKGNLRSTINEKQTIEVFDKDGNVLYTGICNNLNAEPGENETSLFVAFWSEGHAAVSFDVNDAYVINADKLVPFSTKSVYGIGTLAKEKSATLSKRNFAIKTNVKELQDVLKGEVTVRVQNTYDGELAEYDYIVGYPNNVLLNGECVADGDYRHPRTSIGVKADGTIVMAEIDGRQSNINCYGCTLKEEAALMEYYGCVDAFNLDGGGSSTICILEDGELTVQNSTSDGSPRSDGNCLLIVADVRNLPEVSVEAKDVKDNEFTVSLNINKTTEKYNDLYLLSEADNEYRKITDKGTITYSNLESNTKYSYSVFAKVNDRYEKLTTAGAINTAKVKYTITNLEVKYSSDGKYYEVFYDIDDPQTSLLNVILNVNGKGYYPADGKFKIPVEKGSPICNSTQLQIKANRNDLNGTVVDKYTVNARISEGSIVMNGCIQDVKSMINNFFE